MKTIIRGVILKDYLTFRTLVSKVFGVALSLGSGVPIGKMGPFVHIASAVANQMSLLAAKFDSGFGNETRRSECLAAACAVGVACTFSAPVGVTINAFFQTSFAPDAFAVNELPFVISFPHGLGMFSTGRRPGEEDSTGTAVILVFDIHLRYSAREAEGSRTTKRGLSDETLDASVEPGEPQATTSLRRSSQNGAEKREEKSSRKDEQQCWPKPQIQ
ncbi:hypothetical protein ANCCEY_13023 [Ancylostoma ceylanicum]|uniref:Chloride transporter, ClC family n=1 Tax=Ancylostoma ceylanicum TaxID=53326 RepID=A0A0D6L8F4_9BILA|nr:hypothetical protein ANCCEY_13023 [Ancylostoma ceylanicum]